MFAGKICFWANIYIFLWKKDSHEKEGITTKKIVRKKNWNHCAIHEERWDRCFLYVVPVQTTMEYRAREQKIKITSKIHSLHEKNNFNCKTQRESLFKNLSSADFFVPPGHSSFLFLFSLSLLPCFDKLKLHQVQPGVVRRENKNKEKSEVNKM